MHARQPTVGLDLAMNISQVHGVKAEGEVVFNRSLRRNQVMGFFELLEPCLIGIDACASRADAAYQIGQR